MLLVQRGVFDVNERVSNESLVRANRHQVSSQDPRVVVRNLLSEYRLPFKVTRGQRPSLTSIDGFSSFSSSRRPSDHVRVSRPCPSGLLRHYLKTTLLLFQPFNSSYSRVFNFSSILIPSFIYSF